MVFQYRRNRKLVKGSKTQEILAEYRAELNRTLGEKAKELIITKPGAWVYVEDSDGKHAYRLSQIVQMIERLKERPTVE